MAETVSLSSYNQLKENLEMEQARRRTLEEQVRSLTTTVDELREELHRAEVESSASNFKQNNSGLRVGGFSFLKSIPILQTLTEAQLSKVGRVGSRWVGCTTNFHPFPRDLPRDLPPPPSLFSPFSPIHSFRHPSKLDALLAKTLSLDRAILATRFM